MSPLNKSERVPLLCYVTDRRSLLAGETLLHKIAAAATAGVDWIQVREKDLPGKELAQLTQDALRRAANSRTRILVNDRLDVALAMRVDGVHLGEKSLPLEEARRLANGFRRKEDFLIGVSCHSLESAKEAEQGGADYLFFGPVFVTPAKAAYGAPQGIDRLAEVCRTVSIPVLAIGGITLNNVAECLSAGASGIAAIRLFQDAADLATVVRSLRRLSSH